MTPHNYDGFVLWFTGMSGSGKTTLTDLLTPILRERGIKVEVLDGDEVRENLSKGLTFSEEDRNTNVRRIGWVARMCQRNGTVAITAAISPYKAIRDEIRAEVPHGKFIEVYCKATVDALAERDVKGLYKKALAGEIKNFTGVSDPYEEPENPEIECYTDSETVDESLHRILRTLELMNLIPGPQDGAGTDEAEEEKIKARLKELGYI